MTNDNQFPFQRMDSYLVAKEIAVLVHRAEIRHAELRDQATRAAISTFLQLSEGLPNDSRPMRRKYFTCARNSLHEVVAAIDLAKVVGATGDAEARAITERGVRLRGMLIALLR